MKHFDAGYRILRYANGYAVLPPEGVAYVSTDVYTFSTIIELLDHLKERLGEQENADRAKR